MTQAEINEESSCWMCNGLSLAEANIIVLLNQIAGSISGGAAGGIQLGSGSPQGSVTAEPGIMYWDTAGDSLWVKETGSGNTGWIQIV